MRPCRAAGLGALNGMLTVMCGGDAAALPGPSRWPWPSRAPFTHLGDSGAGQLAKMVNQIAVAGLVQGLSEAIAFGQKAGLNMSRCWT
jgi:3-hydroxyisobutyrate dehydrogenase